MQTREKPPKRYETTALPSGGKVGGFCSNCKHDRRSGRPPYDRLLTNPVLRADYRITWRHQRVSGTERTKMSVEHLQAELPALRWVEDQTRPPKLNNQTMLEGGARLGKFWANCKSEKRCAKPPYDRLLANPVLKTDYRATRRGTSGRFSAGVQACAPDSPAAGGPWACRGRR